MENNSVTKEEVKLPKHLQAAVNQLHKQVDILKKHRQTQIDKISHIELTVREFDLSIDYISEQIKKLKGE